MEIRHPVHPDHFLLFDTEDMRDNFLVTDLFIPDRPTLVYSFFDRLIIGGICPLTPRSLDINPAIIGASFLLERRELGLINVGGDGIVRADGEEFEIPHQDGLYLGMGVESIEFSSVDSATPALFYMLSTPAHKQYESEKIRAADIEPVVLGDKFTANCRSINKYIHPGGVQSCQLVMGVTRLEQGSVWNTMPTHTHQRRMEAYFYFDIADEHRVFHLMGAPEETRHLILRNHQAVISPSWSIHSGVGTAAYSFIWGMAGENQDFDDMDHVPMEKLK
ncbi:MAG: 5-dehydro-4-deoxy-D-glucuronate isomerase [Desulfofustis sp.]|nr:5-dehydro-4-deoxy-D-glucuronate isomerase [Desulfofustis sp.]